MFIGILNVLVIYSKSVFVGSVTARRLQRKMVRVAAEISPTLLNGLIPLLKNTSCYTYESLSNM